MLRFKGSQHFRQRLVCSTLSGRPIRIDDIRAADPESPGLREFEASFLRLLEKLTNGCVVEINETGTSLKYRPGVVVCGTALSHDCGTSRGIGYFLEPLVVLGLFGKKPLSITLRGITNDSVDPGVDTFRTVTLPLMRKALGLEDGLELRVVSRGAAPGGGGEVVLRVPMVKQLSPVKMEDEGMVKRIRGVAYSMKVSPQVTNRLVDGARGVLNTLLADVYVFTDATSGAASGKSPGYGITLVAETTAGCLISAEACHVAPSRQQTEGGTQGELVPEDIGTTAAQLLLEEVRRGGVVDGSHQGLLLLLCALGPEEANTLRLGPLTPHAVRTLRHIRDFFGVTFSLRTERSSSTIFATCVGANIRNVSRRVT
ncbi:hypothetical protein CHLRE_09g400367v5 [Chlamydomonas reinhardtii]|uniref:Uncharacterized protein n=1 Tax=Chlamydomonas reinhardtii TaxID=3055 RepID=A8J7U7_CHLRE|nr:uncharacterized protein CHLRE_09g400367v5 [Chlamydomonas reinhardtii]PNW79091.1 hypothetical protein CHLRE_09g400367v5 [Chlamydomonas reinhardtii]|eukprot:XP_001697575.1 RNA terminal 3' phosphate cyclase [Chlamydomonas reinhardtii]